LCASVGGTGQSENTRIPTGDILENAISALSRRSKLAESGASDETIMAIAGHVSRKMLSHYAHIRTEAKRKAAEAISKPAGEVPTAEGASQKVAS
jgi:hypothetical protein